MQGALNKKELLEEYPEDIPPEFDPDLLPHLDRHQVVFFNETHMDQEGGPVFTGKYQVRFPRDNLERYCPPFPGNPNPNSKYGPLKAKPSFKYNRQARFCLGVAATRTTDGRNIGKRSVIFDYLGQRLVSISEYERRTTEEMKMVKTLEIR